MQSATTKKRQTEQQQDLYKSSRPLTAFVGSNITSAEDALLNQKLMECAGRQNVGPSEWSARDDNHDSLRVAGQETIFTFDLSLKNLVFDSVASQRPLNWVSTIEVFNQTFVSDICTAQFSTDQRSHQSTTVQLAFKQVIHISDPQHNLDSLLSFNTITIKVQSSAGQQYQASFPLSQLLVARNISTQLILPRVGSPSEFVRVQVDFKVKEVASSVLAGKKTMRQKINSTVASSDEISNMRSGYEVIIPFDA